MPFESDSVTVRRRGDSTWCVVEPLVYHGRDQTFVVRRDFETDFATVPRAVVWLIPRFGRYTLPAILHDWLVTEGLEQRVVSPRDADGIFRRSMRELGVPVVRRWLMWTGVRWGALVNPQRRRGWVLSAPGVLAVSVLAAPVVVPPALLVLVALRVYGRVERAVSPRAHESPEDAGSLWI